MVSPKPIEAFDLYGTATTQAVPAEPERSIRSNIGPDQKAFIVPEALKAEEMRTYDRLPAELQDLVDNGPHRISALQVRDLLKTKSPQQIIDLVWSLK